MASVDMVDVDEERVSASQSSGESELTKSENLGLYKVTVEGEEELVLLPAGSTLRSFCLLEAL